MSHSLLVVAQILWVAIFRASATTGSTKCMCIDPVALGAVNATGNMVTFAGSPSSNVTSVPKAYATSCKAWDDEDGQEYYESCATGFNGTKPSWCASEWCYIDMCNCDQADLAASSYFTTAANLKLGYSYNTCSSTSSSGTSSYLTTYCSGKDETACNTANSCKYSSGSCVAASKAEILTTVGCTGKTGCKCISPVELNCTDKDANDMVSFTSSMSAGISLVPQQYGTGCSAWDTAAGMEYYNDCKTDASSWCKDPWCYIDMCNCDQADIASSTYFTVKAGLNLGYSYKTCDPSSTTSTSDYLTTYCAALTGSDCGASTVCKLSGADCVGKTPTEITDGLGCPSPAPNPPAQCAADSTPAAGTASGSYKQRMPSFFAFAAILVMVSSGSLF